MRPRSGARRLETVPLLTRFGEGWLGKEATVGAVRLNLAAFGAVNEYITLTTAFVRLLNCFPPTKRACVSPLGNSRATLAAVIALKTPYVLFLNPNYLPGVSGCTVWNAAGLLCFWPNGRQQLVYSPEEESAVKHSTPANG